MIWDVFCHFYFSHFDVKILDAVHNTRAVYSFVFVHSFIRSTNNVPDIVLGAGLQSRVTQDSCPTQSSMHLHFIGQQRADWSELT